MSSTLDFDVPKRFLHETLGRRSKFPIILVGGGGTGSHTVANLVRLYAGGGTLGGKFAPLTIIDPDIVEPRNVGRQLFLPSDVRKPKAQVLAERYSRAYGIEIRYCIDYFEGAIGKLNLRTDWPIILGAVDKATARGEIYTWCCENNAIWIDAGNGYSGGQVIWGNTADRTNIESGLDDNYLVEYMPYPPIVAPGLIDPANDIEKEQLSCGEALETEQQGPNINAIMANVMAEMLKQLLRGELTAHMVELDLTNFRMGSQHITNGWINSVLEMMPNKKKRKKQAKVPA